MGLVSRLEAGWLGSSISADALLLLVNSFYFVYVSLLSMVVGVYGLLIAFCALACSMGLHRRAF